MSLALGWGLSYGWALSSSTIICVFLLEGEDRGFREADLVGLIWLPPCVRHACEPGGSLAPQPGVS